MNTTVFLQLKADLWWYGPSRVLKYAAKLDGVILVTGNVWELPEPFKTDSLHAVWAGYSKIDFPDTPLEIEYKELPIVVGGWHTPSAPFDYDIQRAQLFKADLKLTAKLTNAIKRAIKYQREVPDVSR